MTTFRERAILGRTGLRVSRLGLASGYGVPDDCVERAFHDHGINYFYWSSPRRAGMKRGLERLARAHRHELVIALQTYDHTGFVLSRFHDRGLRALGIDYADVLILGYFNHDPRQRVLDAALELKARGKVRFLALSGHRRAHFRELLARPDSPIDIFMLRYNAAHRGAETEVFPHLPPEGGPGITAYTATRWGQLLQARRMPAGERPLTASECYRFVLSHPRVDLCMIGPANREQFADGVRALDAGPLTPDELARARRLGDHLHG